MIYIEKLIDINSNRYCKFFNFGAFCLKKDHNTCIDVHCPTMQKKQIANPKNTYC